MYTIPSCIPAHMSVGFLKYMYEMKHHLNHFYSKTCYHRSDGNETILAISPGQYSLYILSKLILGLLTKGVDTAPLITKLQFVRFETNLIDLAGYG